MVIFVVCTAVVFAWLTWLVMDYEKAKRERGE